ncbi:MAG: hypothetical protein M1833_000894 [Piccolia ochrophora]|nr:MAG: hypothetical protein M1833_000894 [Piccolia ochrophora]
MGCESSIGKLVHTWLKGIPSSTLEEATARSSSCLCRSISSKFVVYPPLLLLSKSVLARPEWQVILERVDRARLQELFRTIAAALNVTHVAAQESIPQFNQDSTPNILRSPTNLRSLYGNFGAVVAGSATPTDFGDAFWVCAKQNGIKQTWAPLYTMFSRGNVTEKARILSFPDIRDGDDGSASTTAVDLYAGIGYFAFSYLKAGAQNVFCWELNPWSVEGLRRGAIENGWKAKVYYNNQPDVDARMDDSDGLIVFCEDNQHAARRISACREQFPPVRHVNCGLLPTSHAVWEVAVKVLDPEAGGWIHLHENIALDILERRVGEITLLIRRYAENVSPLFQAEWTHVEHVKSYAKGVDHCVIDIRVFRARPQDSRIQIE